MKATELIEILNEKIKENGDMYITGKFYYVGTVERKDGGVFIHNVGTFDLPSLDFNGELNIGNINNGKWTLYGVEK